MSFFYAPDCSFLREKRTQQLIQNLLFPSYPLTKLSRSYLVLFYARGTKSSEINQLQHWGPTRERARLNMILRSLYLVQGFTNIPLTQLILIN